MNVLMLVKNSGVGGVLSCVQSLTEGLMEKGDFVIVGTAPGEGVEKMLGQCQVEIIDFSAKSIKGILQCYKQLKKVVKSNHIEIIHAQNRIPAMYASVFCFFHPKVKYIWSNHLVPISSSFKHRLVTKYGKFAVAEGIDGRNFLIEKMRIPKDKVRIVNLGSDLELFKKTSVEEQKELKCRLGIEPHHKVIMLYGRLAPVKGHLFLLEALAKLPKERRDCLRVIFPGENVEYRQQIDAFAKQSDLTDTLIYPGYVKGQIYLSIADLMVLPSKQEGFGIVNVESFAMGVPVIRTKTAGYLDMEDCCFGIEYGDVEGLKHYIELLWDDPEMLEAKSKVALENVNRFSVEKMTEEYKKIYNECLNK